MTPPLIPSKNAVRCFGLASCPYTTFTPIAREVLSKYVKICDILDSVGIKEVFISS